MQIIIPMSGIGKRFQKAGYNVPKFMIEIEGKTIIEHIIDLFPGESDFLFICNREHLEKTDLEKILKKKMPSGKILGIKPHKLGPVYAVLKVQEYIKDNEPCIVSYCDYNMAWDYGHFKQQMEKTGVCGSIISYKGFHPHLLGPNLYGSVKVDSKNTVLEIREKYSFTKNKMDSWQAAGVYYFKSGKILKKYFSELMEKDIKSDNEYYVSLVHNLMTKDGLESSVYPIDFFCQWGNPEDFEEYKYWSDYFFKKS